MPRFHVPDPLQPDTSIALPAGAARHVQVLRLQPGAGITLFDGQGGEYTAVVERMGRSDVQVRVGLHTAIEREAARAVHLVLGMPANERMDWLVEKATELGAMSIQPLVTERTVLRLSGERAEKKRLHWEAIAIAACEQCGRNRVPRVHPVRALPDWLAQADWAGDAERRVLSLRVVMTSAALTAMATAPAAQAAPTAQASPVAQAAQAESTSATGPAGATGPTNANGPTAPFGGDAAASNGPICIVAGPEGGLTDREEDALIAAGFAPLSLGSRVLRAETAALAALAALVTPLAAPLVTSPVTSPVAPVGGR